MLRKPLVCAGALCLLAMSCQKDIGSIEQIEEVDVDKISYYFNLFEEEGKKRGLTLDLESAGIQGTITNLDHGVAGKCRYHSARPNEILIDQAIWNAASVNTRELIIFHELGHCFLERNHNESEHSDGTCVSIMRSGVMGCRDNYHSKTREQYLDELFQLSSN